MWGQADPLEVQRVWADRLGAFTGDDLRAALDATVQAYADYPPTLPQFAALCRDARDRRSQQVGKLDYSRPPADPVIDQAMREASGDLAKPRADPKKWARDVIQRHDAGVHVPPIALDYAREALR